MRAQLPGELDGEAAYSTRAGVNENSLSWLTSATSVNGLPCGRRGRDRAGGQEQGNGR